MNPCLNLNELVLEVCLFYSSIGLDYSFLIERSIDPMLGISKNFIIDCDLNELIILHKIFTTKPESEWLPIQIKVYQNIVLCLFEIISEDEIDSIIDGIYSEKIKIELIIFLLEEIDDLGKNVKLKKHLISSGELIKKESYYLGVNPNNMIVISARIICLFEKFHLNEEKYSFNTFLGNQIFYL